MHCFYYTTTCMLGFPKTIWLVSLLFYFPLYFFNTKQYGTSLQYFVNHNNLEVTRVLLFPNSLKIKWSCYYEHKYRKCFKFHYIYDLLIHQIALKVEASSGTHLLHYHPLQGMAWNTFSFILTLVERTKNYWIL